MNLGILGLIALALVSCAAAEVPSPGRATPAVPRPPETVPVAQTPVSSEAREIAAAEADGLYAPMFSRDERGLVDRLQFARTDRIAFVRNGDGIAHIKTFVAAHGRLFGYGALGEPTDTRLLTDGTSSWLASVTYPRAERCPNLEIGLLYAEIEKDTDGRPRGMPHIWVAHCPRADNDARSVGDHIPPRDHWAKAAQVAQSTDGDPLVARLWSKGYPLPSRYEKTAGRIRIQYDPRAIPVGALVEVARALVEDVVKVGRLPPLGRETTKRSPGKEPKVQVVEVSYSPEASSSPRPIVRISFVLDLRNTYLTSVEIELE